MNPLLNPENTPYRHIIYATDKDLNEKIINMNSVLSKYSPDFKRISATVKKVLDFVKSSSSNSENIDKLSLNYEKRIKNLKELQSFNFSDEDNKSTIKRVISLLEEKKSNIDILNFVLGDKDLNDEETKIHDMINGIDPKRSNSKANEYRRISIETSDLKQNLYEQYMSLFTKNDKPNKAFRDIDKSNEVFESFFQAKSALEEEMANYWRIEKEKNNDLSDLCFIYNPLMNCLFLNVPKTEDMPYDFLNSRSHLMFEIRSND